MEMKLILSAMVIAQLAAPAFCQTEHQIGSWSVVSSSGARHNRPTTLIQTASQEQYINNAGESVHAQIDVICVKGSVAAIAVDTHSAIDKGKINRSGAADTTLVDYSAGDLPVQSESWAVLDDSRTLSPYSEALQGRRTRAWADRVASSKKLVLGFAGSSDADPIKVTFDTDGFIQALSAAGCSY